MNIKGCIDHSNVKVHYIKDASVPQALEYMKDVSREGDWNLAIVEPAGMLVLQGADIENGPVKAVFFQHLTTSPSTEARRHTLGALELLGVEDTQAVNRALTRFRRGCVLGDFDLPTTRFYAAA